MPRNTACSISGPATGIRSNPTLRTALRSLAPRVELIAQGCAIHEPYEQGDKLVGDGILSYDAVRKQWQQTWGTHHGSIMQLLGGFKDGALVLEGKAHLKDGKSVMQRIAWTVQGKGVREAAEISKDSGETWTPAFDVLFLKRNQGASRR